MSAKSFFFVVVFFAGLLVARCTPAATLLPPTSTGLQTNVLETIVPMESPSPIIESATSTLSPPPTETSFLPTPTLQQSLLQLTYVSNRPCESCSYGIASSLYTMDVGCLDTETPCLGESQLLFDWDERISGIDWSPDGLRLVLESEGNLFIADWNGANAIQIPAAPGNEASPHWSPDGTKIVFLFAAAAEGSDALEPYQIQIYDLVTGQVMSILNNVHAPSIIYWLPGGEFAYVAKISETDWTELINIVGDNGTVILQIPENATDYTHIGELAFSSDMQQLAFVGDITPTTGKTSSNIYLTNINDNSIINLTGGLGFNLSPVWSPLGNWLVFESNREGNWNIYFIKPDGTHLEQVTQSPSDESYPAWRLIP